MLYELRLKNFKQHREATFNFGAGLTTIQGENGEGKTNILKGLIYALYGVSGAGNSQHLTTWGETGMRVDLACDLGPAGPVTITRTLTRAEVWKNGKIIASGQTPVTKWVDAQLGMPSKLSRLLFYAEQGKTQALLDLEAAKLQQQLEAISHVDLIDTVIALIGDDNKLTEGEIKGIGEPEDTNPLHALIEENTQQRQAADKALAGFSRAIPETLADYKAKKGAYDESLLATLNCNKLRTELARVEGQLHELTLQEAQLVVAEVPDVAQEVINALELEINNADREISLRQQEFNLQDRALQQYNSLLEEQAKTAHWEPIVRAYDALGLDILQAGDRLLTAVAELHTKEAEERSSICAACKRPFDDTNLEQLAQDILAAKQQVAELRQVDANLRAEQQALLTTHNTTAAGITGQRTRLQTVKTHLELLTAPDPVDEEARAQLVKDVAALQASRALLEELKHNRKAYKSWAYKLDQVKADIKAAKELADSLHARLSAASVPTEAKLEEMKASCAEAYGSLNDLQLKKAGWEQKVQQLEAEANQLRLRLETASEKQIRLNSLKHYAALRVELQKYLRTNRARLLEDSWASLTHYASHLISTVTDGLITGLVRDETGNFYITEGGNPAPVEELSGARKSIVGLCLRLSLAHLFYGDQGFVLLDEATADCTETNADRVTGMLRGINSQVIMVTHRQSDALNAHHNIVLA